MDNKKKQEIPFGSFDSELMHQEITIPEGFEAVVEGNKIILKKTESEDEKVRKELITHCRNTRCVTEEGAEKIAKWIAFLEKQGEKSLTVDVESMIKSYEQRLLNQGSIEPLTNMCLTAFRHGIEITLDELKLKGFEKQNEKKQKQYDIDVLEKHITKDSISELAHTVIVRNGWEIVDAKEPQNPANKIESFCIPRYAIENIQIAIKVFEKERHAPLANSLRETMIRLEKRWKPTDLQLDCLSDAIERYNSEGYPADVLKTLLRQLKKIG